ncbi:MAG: sigma-70 family RNA polymerase sigma factor [Planctomycetota bacterium]
MEDARSQTRATVSVEELLRESDWLRNVARALTRDSAAADDLAQDVLTDALAKSPRIEPGRLRAWLGTVARRRAGRARHRAESAARAERRAAKSEAAGSLNDDERLRLHGELSEVLRALPPADRHLVLRRYFDGASPREIARELGVSGEVARQRLSRALARLRERLARTDRGERGWSVALLALAEAPRTPPVPLAASGSGLSAAATTPVLVAAAVLPIAALVALLALRSEPEPTPSDVTVAQPGTPENPVELETVAASREQRSAAAGETGPIVAAPRHVVRVVGEDGRARPDARVAWIDQGHEAHALELDAEGVAPRPDAESFRLWVAAPGHEGDRGRIDAAGDVVIRLTQARVLKGTVTVDGAEPGREVRMKSLSIDELDSGLDGRSESLLDRSLRELGALNDATDVLADAHGRFEVALVNRPRWISLMVPSGFRVSTADGVVVHGHRRGVQIAPGDRTDERGPIEVALDLRPLPAIVGRYVWDDDGSPIAGEVFSSLRSEDGGPIGRSETEHIRSDGSFRVAVLPDSYVTGDMDVTAEDVELYVYRPAYLPETVRVVPVRGASFPIDLGVIRVPRLATRRVTVLDEGGARPLRAIIVSPHQHVQTDASGNATVQVGDAEWIDVMAAGYEFSRVHVGSEEALSIRLPRAPSLELRLPQDWIAPGSLTEPFVRLTFESPCFGAWAEGWPPQPNYTHGIHRFLYRSHSDSSYVAREGLVEFALDPDATLQIWGLKRGARFDLAVIDSLGRVLLDHGSVTFDGPGTIDLRGTRVDAAWIECRVIREDDAPVPSGVAAIYTDGRPIYRPFGGDVIHAGPLAVDPCRIRVITGKLRTPVKELGLHAGRNLITLESPSTLPPRGADD